MGDLEMFGFPWKNTGSYGNLYPYDCQRMIDQLSAYMKSTGKIYQDHFATLLLWAGREELKTGSGRYDFEEGESL